MIAKDFNWEQEEKILQWLESEIGFENYGHAIERGLERIRPLFSPYLENWPGKIITIAGTNGKGETSLWLSEIFKKANKTFSLWMSPHVVSIRERVKSEVGQISYDRLLYHFEKNEADQKRLKIHLSFYEFLFLCFVREAYERKSEYLILEVGLGGRLDAVNLFDAEVVGLTSISRDHQNFLGNQLTSILKEKLGVTRAKKLAYSTLTSDFLRRTAKTETFKKFSFLVDLVEANVASLEDSFSMRNKKLAMAIAREFLGDIGNDIYLERFPVAQYHSSHLVFSSAHNEGGFRSLIHALCREQSFFQTIFLAMSERELRDLKSILRSLLAYTRNNAKIYLCKFQGRKSVSNEKIQLLAQEFGLAIADDWKRQLESEAKKKQDILITGSNYFLGDVYRFLLTSPSATF